MPAILSLPLITKRLPSASTSTTSSNDIHARATAGSDPNATGGSGSDGMPMWAVSAVICIVLALAIAAVYAVVQRQKRRDAQIAERGTVKLVDLPPSTTDTTTTANSNPITRGRNGSRSRSRSASQVTYNHNNNLGVIVSSDNTNNNINTTGAATLEVPPPAYTPRDSSIGDSASRPTTITTTTFRSS
ncbi:hypothetical protein MN608_04536 [Microdochium nivale]|nr:hypothetical protein MN608_04536 [Microdochium nivale]